jgi:hypothetical protein
MNLFTPSPLCALACVLACATGSVQAAGADCPMPVFPVYSHDAKCIERVERQVREWRMCVAAYGKSEDSAQLAQLDAEVDARMDKWLVLTRTYSSGQPERQQLLNRIQRDRSEYLAERKSSGRIVYAVERK